MKKTEVIIKLLLIPIFIIDLYLAIYLLFFNEDAAVLIYLTCLYFPILGIVIFHQFFVKKRLKTPWQQYFAVVGFSFLLCWIVDPVRMAKDIEGGVIWLYLFLIMIGVGVMQLLSTFFFKDPPPQRGMSRFLKFFIIALMLGCLYGVANSIFYVYQNYSKGEWQSIWGEYNFVGLLVLSLFCFFSFFWFFFLVTVGHYHYIFHKVRHIQKYYIASVVYMGLMFVLYYMCWYRFVFQQQEYDLKRRLLMGLFFSMLGLPMAFLQRWFFRDELKEG